MIRSKFQKVLKSNSIFSNERLFLVGFAPGFRHLFTGLRVSWQGRIQDFWMGVQISWGGFDLCSLTNFSWNPPWKWNNLGSRGGSFESLEPPLDPPLADIRQSNFVPKLWGPEGEKGLAHSKLSLVTRKPVFGVFDDVRLKPAYSASETS